jgi:hypothetical protein
MLQIAYFLLVLVTWQEHPVMLGPYNITECFDMYEYLDRRGYETSGCESMSLPQDDAIKLEVPYIPTERNTK